MSNKFNSDDITEIASKLKWKPNSLAYNIYYIVICLSIFSLLLVIYLIVLHKDLKCKFKKINKINYSLLSLIDDANNKINFILESDKHLESDGNSNFTNIRYLTKRSERNNDNSSLIERNGMPMFSNEIERSELFSALQGL